MLLNIPREYFHDPRRMRAALLLEHEHGLLIIDGAFLGLIVEARKHELSILPDTIVRAVCGEKLIDIMVRAGMLEKRAGGYLVLFAESQVLRIRRRREAQQRAIAVAQRLQKERKQARADALAMRP